MLPTLNQTYHSPLLHLPLSFLPQSTTICRIHLYSHPPLTNPSSPPIQPPSLTQPAFTPPTFTTPLPALPHLPRPPLPYLPPTYSPTLTSLILLPPPSLNALTRHLCPNPLLAALTCTNPLPRLPSSFTPLSHLYPTYKTQSTCLPPPAPIYHCANS